ncbi:MAG: DUF937 domain-containing protein [Verrucomicrobia bacterium]|nr:DUF937 domain-containing protein [Verrucomicrobiota bacterium]
MSFFQSILAAVADPNHAGNQGDLQSWTGIASLLPGLQGAERQLQPILDVLGSHVKDALSEQQQAQGSVAVQQSVTDLAQGGVTVPQLQDFFGAERFNQIVGDLAQRTGLSESTLLGMLPMLLPVVMRLLSTGNHVSNPQAPNPVLGQFLNSNQGGGALLSEAFQLASQFLSRPR